MVAPLAEAFDAEPAPSSFAPLVRVAAALRPAQARWAFAGGWALDVHAGAVGRAHEDVDVVVDQRDATALLDVLQRAGAVIAWVLGAPPAAERRPRGLGEVHRGPGHQAEARLAGWRVDVALEPWADDAWHHRRDRSISWPLERAVVRRALPDAPATVVPLLAVAPILLFKATAGEGSGPRPKDDADLARMAPWLSAADRVWLRQSLAALAPGHAWIAPGGPLA